MTPWQRYQQDLLRDDFSVDAAQELAVKHLQRLFDDLMTREKEKSGIVFRIKSQFSKPPEPIKGLYFWGGVGRGKTYLVDTFFECLPFEQKIRIHFHRFMQRVHLRLTELQGIADPLEAIADDFATEARVICFDEFFVSDITDAMILGGLMEAMFARGITLVATSNIVPNELYKNGLQRSRFLPAIDLVNKHTVIVNVDSGVDYRLRTLETAEIYHSPLDAQADVSLRLSFDRLASTGGDAGAMIQIESRDIQAINVCEGVLWCDFLCLCDGPRSQNDYIELARIYHAVLISGVPVLGVARDDQARRFVNLVDEFYDRNVKLILSAEADIDGLYTGGRLDFEFERTKSRLLEMQSHEYLAREHKP
ncbi:MAG: AFG1 family ATPase [Pseudomonadales bacterium]|nr:AFG1 family ATPase [Pseudomonadales bacterium]